MKSKLKTFAGGLIALAVGLGAPTAAFASCTTDCYAGCYQAFGDNPGGYMYRGCLADCNDKCLPNPGSGVD